MSEPQEEVEIYKIKIDRQGYTKEGKFSRYYGVMRESLYEWYFGDGVDPMRNASGRIRASNRTGAKRHLKKMFPNAKIVK